MKTSFMPFLALAGVMIQLIVQAQDLSSVDPVAVPTNWPPDQKMQFGAWHKQAGFTSSDTCDTNTTYEFSDAFSWGETNDLSLSILAGPASDSILNYFYFYADTNIIEYLPTSGVRTDEADGIAAYFASLLDDAMSGTNVPSEVESYQEMHTGTSYQCSLTTTNPCSSANGDGITTVVYTANFQLSDPYVPSHNPDDGEHDPNCGCDYHDMPRWYISEPYLNLWCKDTPVFYTTSLGQEINFTVAYKQRDTRPTNTMVPPTGWSHNWFSYVHFVVPTILSGTNSSAPGFSLAGATGRVQTRSGWVYTNDFSRWQAILYATDDGEDYFSNTGKTEAKTGLTLITISTNGDSSVGFRLLHPDGSVDEYATVSSPTFSFGLATSRGRVRDLGIYPPKLVSFGSSTFSYYDTGNSAYAENTADQATPPPIGVQVGYEACDAVLTKRIDRYGNAITLNYNSTPPYYLQSLVDYDGRTTTLSYDVNGMVSGVSMPYGRTASFNYSGTSLGQITDAQGMSSSMSYSESDYADLTGSVANFYLASLTTPYGTTTFNHYEAPPVLTMSNPPSRQITYSSGSMSVSTVSHGTSPVWVGFYGGTNRVNRACTVTYPDGTHELYMFRYDSQGLVPTNYPAGEIPYADLSSDIDDGSVGGDAPYAVNHLLSTRNSFHWNRQQYATLSTNDVTRLTGADYLRGTMKHWLEVDDTESIYPQTSEQNVSDQVSLIREASPNGVTEGAKTWVVHGGQSRWLAGDYDYDAEATILPDASVRVEANSYDSGMLLETSDTYTEVDGSRQVRNTTYDYDSSLFSIAPDYSYLLPAGYSSPHYGFNLSYPSDFEIDRTDPGGTTQYFYNSRHQITGIKHANGLTTTNYYDGSGFLSGSIDLEAQATNSYTFANGLPATRITPLGQTQNYFWDKLSRLTGVGFPDGTTVSNLYNRLDIVSRKDRLNHWTYASFDSMQQPATTTDANGGVTSYSFCFCGGLGSVTDPLGNSTTYNRDYDGNVTSEVSSDGFTTTYTRNLVGQVTSVANSAGLNLSYTYDNQGLVTNVSSSSGKVSSVLYDYYDNPIQVTDAQGVTITNAFDGLRRVTDQWNAHGHLFNNSYSAQGLSLHYDAFGRETAYGYDPAGRLAGITDANGNTNGFTYNALGQLMALADGNGHVTSWAYDMYGHQVAKADGNNVLIETNGYDAAGRLTAHWTPAKGLTQYAYDPNGNMTGVSYSSGPTVSAGYDALNRVTSLNDAVGSSSFTYANFGAFAGALASEDGPWASDTVTYGYTHRQPSSLSLAQPSGSWNVSYGYDSLNRLASVGSTAGTFGYNYAGAARSIGTLTLPGSGNEIDYAYDGAGSLRSTALKHGGTVLDGYTYAYDGNGNRTSVTRADNAVVNYGYDSIGQLTSAVGTEPDGVTPRVNENFSYGFDPAGNLLQRTNNTLIQTFATDGANQLLNITRNNNLLTVAGSLNGSNSFTINGQGTAIYHDLTFAVTNGVAITSGLNVFTAIAVSNSVAMTNQTLAFLPTTVNLGNDANGNMISDGLHGYDYDCANELTRVTITNILKAEFTYDGFGRRRIRKDFTWSTNQWLETNEVHYVYDGMTVIQERDSNNVPKVSYTRGTDLSGTMQGAGGIGGLLARTDGSGTSLYHADGNGNVTMLVNSSGMVLAKYLYDPSGNPLGMWGPLATANTYRFSSMETYDPAGMVLYTYRVYFPNLQRWPNRDPLGEAGGINLYAYVQNNPINYFDPLGLAIFPPGFIGPRQPGDTYGEPPGGPPMSLPDGKDGKPNAWVPKKGSGPRPKWGPRCPIRTPTGSQPGGSWDGDQGHWDIDNGDGTRTRLSPGATPVDHFNNPLPTPASPVPAPPVGPWWMQVPIAPLFMSPMQRLYYSGNGEA